ncbi:MAG: hypothetical protein H6706_18025 [Myxococcales bacterium]|nr:hypothetical protein [Myxococcales bacterium]
MKMHALALTAALAACGGAPPTVPDAPPAGSCEVIDPSTLSGTSTQPKPGPGLSKLLPGRGPGPALPLTLPQLLSMTEVPADAQWRALPPGSDAALVQIAQDANAGPPERARALAGLAIRKTEGAGPAIAALLLAGGGEAAIRRAAARALAAGFVAAAAGAEGDQAPALLQVLADPDDQLREAVVKALAPHAGRDDVRAALLGRQGVEQNELVKEALGLALSPKE